METPQSQRIAAALALRVEAGADAGAAPIADTMVWTWQAIDNALRPIIGHGGVIALYHRSLHLTDTTHTWLAGAHGGLPSVMDLEALKSVFALQGSANAAAAGGALLQAFHELLASLVGPELTGRLLRHVWTDLLNGSPAQDTSP